MKQNRLQTASLFAAVVRLHGRARALQKLRTSEQLNRPTTIAIAIDLSWPFKRHLEVFDGISRYAVKAGWNTVLLPMNDATLARRTDWTFQGIVGRIGNGTARRAKRAKVPVVNVWCNSPATGIASVFPDWKSAGRMAADHLADRGFRRFAYLGFRRDRGAELQVEGFRNRLQSRGMDCDCHFVVRSFTESQTRWERFTRQLARLTGETGRPVGIFTSDDLLGRYVLDSCLRAGHQVPGDVAVISTHNEPLICENSMPSLSSIEVGYPQIGWRAAEQLEKLMRKDRTAAKSTLHAPNSLVLRQSTDAFAVGDALVAEALRFIAGHSHRPINVSDVAKHVAASRRTLERRFQEILHRTIAAQITRDRMERTKRQLLESNEPVKMIAHQNGFRDASHLCTVFHRECGMTPGAFREQQSSG